MTKFVLKALGNNDQVDQQLVIKSSLNKKEKIVFERVRNSISEIKLHQEGKIQLQTIEDFLTELS